eukprot:2539795-Rhodomonas_salina.1
MGVTLGCFLARSTYLQPHTPPRSLSSSLRSESPTWYQHTLLQYHPPGTSLPFFSTTHLVPAYPTSVPHTAQRTLPRPPYAGTARRIAE